MHPLLNVRQLTMKRELWELVKQGKKTITIRKYTRIKPGDVVQVNAGGKIVGEIEVTNVYRKKLDEIGEEEAKKEGMPLDELKRLLKRLYGRNATLHIIEFKLRRVYDPPIDPEQNLYGGRSVVSIARELLKRPDLSPHERRILELVVREGGIRGAAMALGGLHKRKIIRRVIRQLISSSS